MNAGPHLVLIGLMGAGKTTVGQNCARGLGRAFVDTDAVVEANAGETVPEIFAREGEAGFRARERAALVDALAAPEPLVIACGGGAILDPENRRTVRDRGFVVWLQASPEVLAERVERDGVDARPMLAGGSPTITLTRLAAARAGAYAAAADAVVSTVERSVEAVAELVLDALAASDRDEASA